VWTAGGEHGRWQGQRLIWSATRTDGGVHGGRGTLDRHRQRRHPRRRERQCGLVGRESCAESCERRESSLRNEPSFRRGGDHESAIAEKALQCHLRGAERIGPGGLDRVSPEARDSDRPLTAVGLMRVVRRLTFVRCAQPETAAWPTSVGGGVQSRTGSRQRSHQSPWH
jgi:hypothetical protein